MIFNQFEPGPRIMKDLRLEYKSKVQLLMNSLFICKCKWISVHVTEISFKYKVQSLNTKLYTKFLNNVSKTLEFRKFRIYNKHCFSQLESSSRECACFYANYIKGNIKMHLYLKFEREIFKIVKVIAVLTFSLMHVHHTHRHACMCFHANMTVAYCRYLSNTSIFQV